MMYPSEEEQHEQYMEPGQQQHEELEYASPEYGGAGQQGGEQMTLLKFIFNEPDLAIVSAHLSMFTTGAEEFVQWANKQNQQVTMLRK